MVYQVTVNAPLEVQRVLQERMMVMPEDHPADLPDLPVIQA